MQTPQTPHLNSEIARLELEQKHNLLDKLQKTKLQEFKAIKQALNAVLPNGTLCSQPCCKNKATHIAYTEYWYHCETHRKV